MKVDANDTNTLKSAAPATTQTDSKEKQAAQEEAERKAQEQAALKAQQEAERKAAEEAAALKAQQEAEAARKAQEQVAAQQAASTSVYYKNCDAVRAAGAAPIHSGEPGYAKHLDRDGDGIACDR